MFRESDPARRTRALTFLFHARLIISRLMGGTTLGMFPSAGGACVATLTIGPIASQNATFCVKVRAGLLAWPFRFGFSSLGRATSLGAAMTAASLAVNGRCDFELMMVATAVDQQGRGLGSRMLREALAWLRNSSSPATAITVGLATQNLRTCEFYARVGGFAVTGERSFLDGDERFQSWTMKLELESA
jgi:ribosomal protein S18 acetylase RimI-like enzyme